MRNPVRWHAILIAGVCAALCVLPGRGSAADSYYVTPTGAGSASGADWANAFSSVQDAADLALNADDVIYLQSGIYSNTSQIVISNAAGVTLVGGCVGEGGSPDAYSGTNSTLTKTGGVMRIFFGYASTVTVEGVTISDGYFSSGANYGAGLYFQNCAMTLTNCVVSGNTNLNTSGYGGGMYCSGGTLAVNDCVFSNNYIKVSASSKGGGALAGINTPMAIADTLFVTNAAGITSGHPVGGALYSGGASVLITNCVFHSNSSRGNYGASGGAVYVSGGSSALIASSAFISHFTIGNFGIGGALYLNGLQSATVQSNSFVDNCLPASASSHGSALSMINCSTATVDHCFIESEKKIVNADYIYVNGGTNIYILNTTVRGNTNNMGIYFAGAAASSLTMTNCLVVNNANNGLWITNGTVTVANCTIAANAGWGITNAGALTVKNSIVWANAAGGIATNATSAISYTDSQELHAGPGNMNADPLFVNPADGNYHLMSLAGSWRTGDVWINDPHMSPCIDAGDPGSAYALEPKPNGGRVNLGRYGNTDQASRSSRGMTISIW